MLCIMNKQYYIHFLYINVYNITKYRNRKCVFGYETVKETVNDFETSSPTLFPHIYKYKHFSYQNSLCIHCWIHKYMSEKKEKLRLLYIFIYIINFCFVFLSYICVTICIVSIIKIIIIIFCLWNLYMLPLFLLYIIIYHYYFI